MAGVDLNRYRFDFDLTFCALLMRADGHLYHTFGGRTWRGAQSHLSVAAFVRALGLTLEAHRSSGSIPSPKLSPPRTVEQFPPLARRIAAGNAPECVHCHSVHDWQVQTAVEAGQWLRETAWLYPDPIEWGIELDSVEQNRIVAVHPTAESVRIVESQTPGSVGTTFERGDRIVRIDGVAVATFGDFTRALHRITSEASTTTSLIQVDVVKAAAWESWRSAEGSERSPPTQTVQLQLSSDWRIPDPLTYSWRAMKWNLEPAPGFGGPQLDRSEIATLGLPAGTFAYRVGYLVTWGHRKYTGVNAARAGIREGDVVLSIAGKRDFESIDHVHAWYRLTQQVGDTIPIELLRGKEKRVVMLEVVGPESQ